jgi:hypothetical protein
VREVAGTKDGVAGLEGDAMVAGLDEDLAFEDVEPLVLREVDVEGRAPAGRDGGVLDGEEAGGVGGGGLEVEFGVGGGVGFAKAVCAGGDEVREGVEGGGREGVLAGVLGNGYGTGGGGGGGGGGGWGAGRRRRARRGRRGGWRRRT